MCASGQDFFLKKKLVEALRLKVLVVRNKNEGELFFDIFQLMARREARGNRE